jgi:hypothetical protein
VTVNAAFDHVRARKRRPATVADEAVPEIPAAVDEYERAELARRVESTLRELPKRQQLALVLRDVNGLSVGETASVLGLTKGSADVLLSRARAGFRRVFLAGAGALTGRCDRADGMLAAGVGRGEPVPAALLEHSRTCPDCRRAVKLWGAAPVGLGLLLPQVALPAKLSLGATLAAAQAAGIALPAGLGAAGAAGASVAASGASAAGTASAAAGAGATAAAGASAGAGATAAAAGAGGVGLLAALGSATGVKVATLAAVAAAAVGIAGVSTQRFHTAADASRPPAGEVRSTGAAAHGAPSGADGSGLSPRERARLVERAHRGDSAAGKGERGGSRAARSGGAGPSDPRDGASASAGAGQSRSGGATRRPEGGSHSSSGAAGGSGSGSGSQGTSSGGGQSTGGSGSGGDAGQSGGAGGGAGLSEDSGGSPGGTLSQE